MAYNNIIKIPKTDKQIWNDPPKLIVGVVALSLLFSGCGDKSYRLDEDLPSEVIQINPESRSMIDDYDGSVFNPKYYGPSTTFRQCNPLVKASERTDKDCDTRTVNGLRMIFEVGEIVVISDIN